MRISHAVAVSGAVLMLSLGAAGAQKKPADIRPNHPATQAVRQVLDQGVMGFTEGANFRGEAKVTRAQAVAAVAKLARALENGQWKAQRSVALPAKVQEMQVVDSTQPVTRYTMAMVLSRFGNYLKNALNRPKAGAKDLAKSRVLPTPPRITVPASHPAYASLTYLAGKRMIQPGSPLLKADNQPVQSAELSRALAEMATGLTNQWSELGQEEDGSTPDRSFRKNP